METEILTQAEIEAIREHQPDLFFALTAALKAHVVAFNEARPDEGITERLADEPDEVAVPLLLAVSDRAATLNKAVEAVANLRKEIRCFLAHRRRAVAFTGDFTAPDSPVNPFR